MMLLFRIYALAAALLAGEVKAGALTDSLNIRVHFLHGSKPKRKYRQVEHRWFGGVLGGHAGVEIEKNRILNFGPRSRFHLFHKRSVINSGYFIHDTVSFYAIHGSNPDSVKKTIISIPITSQQKLRIDSLATAYLGSCPYDYAFFGMRCGAAAYDILAAAGVVKKYSFGKTWRKIFYPRKLRRRLEREAKVKGYEIRRQEGSQRRRWERN